MAAIRSCSGAAIVAQAHTLVFYDGPGGNATDWHSHNFTICNLENAGCDAKYKPGGETRSMFLQDFASGILGMSI